MYGNQDGPMTDEQLKTLMEEAAQAYRVPADPPLDRMWARVEREHFDAPKPASRPWAPGVWRARRWLAPAVGIAATLAIGFGLGRFTAQDTLPLVTDAGQRQVADAANTGAEGTLRAPNDADSHVSDPLQRTTSAYLDDAELLLASLPRDAKGVDAAFVRDAHRLLTTTRVLLDSPVGADPRLRDMLEDLELILAQVARLQAAPRPDELTFIAEAMDERDMVPRLRTVAAALSYSDY